MIRTKKKVKKAMAVAMLAIGAAVLSLAPEAYANLVMTLDDLSTPGVDVIIVDDFDGGVGTLTGKGFSNTADGSAGDGAINFNGVVGSFTVNVTTGVSKPIIGNSAEGRIDLNSVNVSGAAGSLEIMLTDTDFLVDGQGVAPISLHSDMGGTTDGTVTWESFLDTANAEFGATISNGPDSHTGPPDSFALSQSFLGPILGVGNPFSLSQTVRIDHNGAGDITSFDHIVGGAAVPEPSTYALLGMGLIGLFGYHRRMNKKQAKKA